MKKGHIRFDLHEINTTKDKPEIMWEYYTKTIQLKAFEGGECYH